MYKLSYVGDTAEHIKKYGDYNDFPPNWEEINAQEFWNKFGSYMPDFIEFRQMIHPEEKMIDRRMTGAHLYYFFKDEHLAVAPNYTWVRGKYLYQPKFFKFGACKHEWKETNKSRMCYHVYECNKCHIEYAVDSSD